MTLSPRQIGSARARTKMRSSLQIRSSSHTSVSRSASAAHESEALGAVVWRRLAVEAALRLAWAAGDELEADTTINCSWIP